MTIDPVPRREWTVGLGPSGGKDPAWSTGGTIRRAACPTPFDYLAIHFAGGGSPTRSFADVDPLKYVRDMFTWAHRPESLGGGGKGDEYGFVLAGRARPTFFEWAGTFQAAHCTYWNRGALSLHLALDTDDEMPEVWVPLVAEFRRWAESKKILATNHRVGPHYEYLGTQPPTGPLLDGRLLLNDANRPLVPVGPWPAGKPDPAQRATTCWGTKVEKYRAALTAPLVTPPIAQETDVKYVRTNHPHYPVECVVQLDANTATRIEPGPYARLARDGKVPDHPSGLPFEDWRTLAPDYTFILSPI